MLTPDKKAAELYLISAIEFDSNVKEISVYTQEKVIEKLEEYCIKSEYENEVLINLNKF